MVYINSKKYACESCIKGHRSSSCAHNDRPLFEIKKKGRPVSQCEKCREARQSRRIHAKCTCDIEKAEKSAGNSSGSGVGSTKRGKRFIPTVPSLPNGLKDALRPQTLTEGESSTRRQVEALLNPCHCKDVYNCTCRSQDSASGRSSISPSIFNDGLSALAHVAACCAPASSSTLPAAAPVPKSSGGVPAYDRNGTKITFDTPPLYSGPSRLPIITEAINPTAYQGPSLARNSYGLPPSFQPLSPRPSLEGSSSFGSTTSVPSVNASSCCSSGTSSSTVDGNCGCGQQCACAGCASHESEDTSPDSFYIRPPSEQGPSSTRPAHKANCAADCPTCVDYDGGAELPGTKQTPTFIDQFLQRAATLPPPPSSYRTRSMSLDPTNVVVYPPHLFTGAERDERSRAFGLVNIPKLECCGGRCSCPEGQCGCGESCGGCCVDDGDPLPGADTQHASPSVSFARRPVSRGVGSSGYSS